MKRYLIALLAMLVLPSGLAIACSQEAGPTADDDVRLSFYKVAKSQVLPDREEIFRWWSNQIMLGEVKYIKEKDLYEIQFPDMELKGVEVWVIDMKSSRIYPNNVGALMSAIVLFCRDRNDQRGDCQLYLRQVDALKRSLGK